MAKNLVIVESPAKAKTIEGFLGKDFLVKSSFGHVRDLSKKGLSVDVEKGFMPTYEISPDKGKVIDELKKLAKKAEIIWLATDEDREGEAISWHLFEALGLKKDNTKRIVFHEITKPAIIKAIESPRTIDIKLVEAQQARRVLDRLVGYELSPVLWKKIKPSLSAGRVQSVAVRLIVEREREISAFNSTSAFKISALFSVSGKTFKAELSVKFDKEEEARRFLEQCVGADFKVTDIETKPSKRSPSPPFTTSTLQQEASRKLGYSVSQTMVVAQKLYESGKITYMRTDSVNLSDTAIQAAKEQVSKQFGPEYSQVRKFQTKSKGAQEAHEAIRPTYMENSGIDGDNSEKRLYDLIWKRTIASQMSDAQLEKTTVKLKNQNSQYDFIAKGEVIKFEGFLKVYLESTDDDENEGEEGMLPAMNVGDQALAVQIDATERFTHHPARYTEASLVKKLEELGIGRPSTYAPTISTIQKRNYVVKEDRLPVERKYRQMSIKDGMIVEELKTENTGAEKNKLFPTDIGAVVNDFLLQYFPEIMDYNFTATVEQEFDDIAEGKLAWNKMIAEFYKTFHADVEKTTEVSERATGERLLGKDPSSGKNVYARIGRFGPLVQIGESDDEEKPKFASIRKDQRLEDITLEQALDLFKLPRVAGSFEGNEMVIGIGRFGPYIRHDNKFVSIPKEEDPMSISQARAIELIEGKRKAAEENLIKTFTEDESIQVLKGRFGPYIKAGKNNYKIPKDKEPSLLTYEDVRGIIEAAPVSKKQKNAAKEKQAPVPKTSAKPKAKKKASPKKSVKKKKD